MAAKKPQGDDELRREIENDLGPDTIREPKEMTSNTRAIAAAKLAVLGATDLEIAETLGYADAAKARMAWEAAIASTADPSTDFVSRRKLRMGQLDAMIKAIAPKALNRTIVREVLGTDNKVHKVRVDNEELIPSAMLMLRLVDRAIRLEGLDAPQVMSLVTPGVKDFEAVVGQLVQTAKGAGAEEGDIFELTMLADGSYGQPDDDQPGEP